MGPTILSCCWNAELVIGRSGCHRARSAIKARAGNVRRILKSERWDADRTLGLRAVLSSPDGSDKRFRHSSLNGETR